MDGFSPRARTVAEYTAGTTGSRTDFYCGPGSGTLLSHKGSIQLFKQLGANMTPELKSQRVKLT